MTITGPAAIRLLLALLAAPGAAAAQGATTSQGTCLRSARVETLGLATAGANGLLELAVEGAPVAGLPFRLVVRNALPGTQGTLAISAKQSPLFLHAFGATVFPTPPLLELPFAFDASGASPPLLAQTPVDPALCGIAFYTQAAALDPAAMGGASFSKALRVRFGGAAAGPLFASGPSYTLPWYSLDAEVGDLDGDQLLDVALATQTGTASEGALAILFGAGDGTLGPAQILPTGDNGQDQLAVGDVDGDGADDVVLSHGSPFELSGVKVVLSDGAGGFHPPVLVSAEETSRGVGVADVNGDGWQDLVYARDNLGPFYCTCDDVRVLLGTGGGGFLPPMTFPVDHRPVFLAIADLDADGALDVATGNHEDTLTPSTVSVLMGLGDGTFLPHLTLQTDTPDVQHNNAAGIEAADFGLDGLVDLAALVTYFQNGRVSLFTSLGGGAFSPAANHPVGFNVNDLAVADVDRELHPDVLVVNSGTDNGVVLLRAAGDGTLLPAETYPLPYDVLAVAAGDLNGDFLPDAVLGVLPLQVVALRNELFP